MCRINSAIQKYGEAATISRMAYASGRGFTKLSTRLAVGLPCVAQRTYIPSSYYFTTVVVAGRLAPLA